MNNDMLDLAILQDHRKELEDDLNEAIQEFLRRYPMLNLDIKTTTTCTPIRCGEICHTKALIILTLKP